MLPRKTAYNTYLQSFQFKILNNILFLNKNLFICGFEESSLCLFSNLEDKTPLHLFFDCHTAKFKWIQLDNYFSNDFTLLTLTPQTALFEIFNNSSIAENVPLINHILLIFKLHVYKCSKNIHRICTISLSINTQ